MIGIVQQEDVTGIHVVAERLDEADVFLKDPGADPLVDVGEVGPLDDELTGQDRQQRWNDA